MPSPFPGMDPFLEDPAVFAGLHNRFVAYLSESLQAVLPAPYYADIGDRVWVEVGRRYIEPDVNVLRSRRPEPEPPPGCGVAVLEAMAGVVIHAPFAVVREERRETSVEILTRREGEERLVTTIELLSPSNKTPGEQGRQLYLRKQQEILAGRTAHLVEIDLLRGGQHATTVPLEAAVKRTGLFTYHACVHFFDRPDDYLVYPFLLADRLPRIAVPLLPGDAPVTLDLQAVFDRAFDTGPYPRRVRYDGPVPAPALSAEQAEWVTQTLRAKGLLPAAPPA